MKMQTPNKKHLQKYLNKWATLENYVLQERSLKKLYTKTYPKNNNIDEVLIKVCSLNDFYSTNIFSPFKIAKYIVDLNIDLSLNKGDLSLVNKIALVKVNGEKTINFYSFASKYCSHHKPEVYPIYDYFVEKILKYFRKVDKFTKFKNADLKNYESFEEILQVFRTYYQLEEFSLKELDQYLWLLGKEKFPKQY